MVRHYIRKTNRQKRYCSDDLKAAIIAVRKNGVKLHRAAIHYHIPKATLQRHVLGRCQSPGEVCGGKKRTLSTEQEKELCRLIDHIGSQLNHLTRTEMRKLAYIFCERNQIPHQFSPIKNCAGSDWLSAFMKRNPGIKWRRPNPEDCFEREQEFTQYLRNIEPTCIPAPRAADPLTEVPWCQESDSTLTVVPEVSQANQPKSHVTHEVTKDMVIMDSNTAALELEAQNLDTKTDCAAATEPEHESKKQQDGVEAATQSTCQELSSVDQLPADWSNVHLEPMDPDQMAAALIQDIHTKTNIPGAEKNKRPRGLWAEKDMQAAVEAVNTGGYSVRRAAAEWKVPRNTLLSYCRENSQGSKVRKRKKGRSRTLTVAQEQLLCQQLEELGYQLTKGEVRRYVYTFCQINGIEHRFSDILKSAGTDWLEDFRNRNPQVRFNQQVNLSKDRRHKFEQLLKDMTPTDFAGTSEYNNMDIEETDCSMQVQMGATVCEAGAVTQADTNKMEAEERERCSGLGIRSEAPACSEGVKQMTECHKKYTYDTGHVNLYKADSIPWSPGQNMQPANTSEHQMAAHAGKLPTRLGTSCSHRRLQCVEQPALYMQCVDEEQETRASKVSVKNMADVILKAMQSFREHEQFCDVYFVTANHTFKAHKLVLASLSKVFQQIMNSTLPNSLLKINLDVQSEAVEHVLNFVYGNQFTVTDTIVDDCLKVAKMLDLTQLMKICRIHKKEQDEWFGARDRTFIFEGRNVRELDCDLSNSADKAGPVEIQVHLEDNSCTDCSGTEEDIDEQKCSCVRPTWCPPSVSFSTSHAHPHRSARHGRPKHCKQRQRNTCTVTTAVTHSCTREPSSVDLKQVKAEPDTDAVDTSVLPDTTISGQDLSNSWQPPDSLDTMVENLTTSSQQQGPEWYTVVKQEVDTRSDGDIGGSHQDSIEHRDQGSSANGVDGNSMNNCDSGTGKNSCNKVCKDGERQGTVQTSLVLTCLKVAGQRDGPVNVKLNSEVLEFDSEKQSDHSVHASAEQKQSGRSKQMTGINVMHTEIQDKVKAHPSSEDTLHCCFSRGITNTRTNALSTSSGVIDCSTSAQCTRPDVVNSSTNTQSSCPTVIFSNGASAGTNLDNVQLSQGGTFKENCKSVAETMPQSVAISYGESKLPPLSLSGSDSTPAAPDPDPPETDDRPSNATVTSMAGRGTNMGCRGIYVCSVCELMFASLDGAKNHVQAFHHLPHTASSKYVRCEFMPVPGL